MRPLVPIVAALVLLAGCVVEDVKPLPKVDAKQAVREIPAEQRLDIVVHPFDPGIPAEIAADEDAMAKKRIYPEMRKAEARYFAVMLRNTLESSAQWGAVRVAPDSVQFVDVAVSARIVESTGKHLALEVTARDAAGRTWLDAKHYEGDADVGSYKTDASLKARDPFQNVFSNIANDIVAARDKLDVAALRELHQVSGLQFAADIAPDSLSGYLQKDEAAKPALIRVVRLPASNDPIAARVQRIRERDTSVLDTLDGYYTGFSEQMQQPYGDFRRTSWDEIDKQERALASARARTFLGAAAVAASIFAPGGCSSNATCNLESAARYAGAIGGITSVLSGLKKYSDARTHAQAFGELARSFQGEVASQVVDVEGRSLRLTGTAEEQYREWRQLLRDYQTATRRRPMASLESGRLLADRYQLQDRLGDGGHAEVWKARDTRGGRVVALKFLHLRGGGAGDALPVLQHEANMAQRLDHPGVLKLDDPQQDGSFVFLPMELAVGGDASWLRGAPWQRVLPVLLQAARVLEHVHGRGVVHRDLKARNVLFNTLGNVLLSDFGTAASTGSSDAPASGSPFSASPQQLRDEPAAPADDVYGLGALAHELLTRYPPFYPNFDKHRVQLEDPPRPVPVHPAPEGLLDLVQAMLARDAAARPDLASIIRAFEGLMVVREATPESEATLVTEPARVTGAAAERGGPRLRGGLLWMLGILVIGGIAALLWLPDPAPPCDCKAREHSGRGGATTRG